MKKLLAGLLALTMLFSIVPFGGIVSAASSVTVTVGTAYAAKSGATVYVPVSLSAYTNGYAGVQISNVSYDTSALTFVGFVSYSDATQPLDTNGFTDGYYETSGKALSYMIAPSSTTQAAKADGGILAYIKFTTAKAITSNVSVSVTVKEILTYTKGSSDKWVAWEKASVSVTAGKVAPDTTVPTASISTTNNVAASQTITLTMGDTTKLIGYYYGTNSTYSSNTFTTTSATSATKTITASGTYYLTTKDAAGNVSTTASITFYKTTLNANGGSVSPSAIVNASGKSVTLPTPTRTDYIFKGWSTSSTATSGSTSITVSANKTYYATWSDAKIKAAEVDSLITAIGTVTLSSESKITAARTAYNALSDEAKGYVAKLSTLTAAESKLATLKADKSAADAVVTKISNIGTVTLSSETKITAARSAYNALTDAQKDLVTNYSTLTAAESKLATLKADKSAADAVVSKISAIGTVTLSSETKITAARSAYNALTDAQKDLVTNYSTLTAAESRLATLKSAKTAAANVDTLIGK
ncbi:MAG: InlB B-repeat-containing protein, partial [Clostridia bacterium]|nr:InlB B-repeat-containing protein [Clostridia bacterium]